jgi:hypothetical protein
VRTGEAKGAPVIDPLKTFPVKIVDDRIYVQVSAREAEGDAAAQAKDGP